MRKEFIDNFNENFGKYSDDRENLKKLLKSLSIKIDFLKYDKYFQDDKEKRNIYTVTMRRNGKQISFTFGDSIRNSKNGEMMSEDVPDSIYSILACCRSDFYVPENFKEFCNEFGYEFEFDYSGEYTEAKKTIALHKRCLKQSEKLHKIFNEDEIQYLPS